MGIKLHRDKETGKSKGFAFLRYDDPRSCILAVDNFNGISLLNRRLAVNHVKEYKQADEMDVVAEQTLDNLSDEDERESTKKRKEKRREAKSLDLVKAVMSQDPIQQQLAIEKVKRREERKRQRRERNAEQVDPDTEQEESSQRNQEDFANARASSSGNDNAELT